MLYPFTLQNKDAPQEILRSLHDYDRASRTLFSRDVRSVMSFVCSLSSPVKVQPGLPMFFLLSSPTKVKAGNTEEAVLYHCTNDIFEERNLCLALLGKRGLLGGLGEPGDAGTPGEVAEFMKELETFHRIDALNYNPPKFYEEPLNCLKLWRDVFRLGGYELVFYLAHLTEKVVHNHDDGDDERTDNAVHDDRICILKFSQPKFKAVEILVKDLKVFSTFNEELFKEITQLLTLENFRENEQLSKYGDTKSARAIMLVELKKLIEANPLFRDKLQFPNLRNSRFKSVFYLAHLTEKVVHNHDDGDDERTDNVVHDDRICILKFSQPKFKAVEILVKDLKVFSTFNEELFKEITQLLTLENFRENEQLSKYGDTKSARAIMLVELKKLIEANPLFRDKLQFPNLRNSRFKSVFYLAHLTEKVVHNHDDGDDERTDNVVHDDRICILKFSQPKFKAVEILVKDLKVFSTFNEELFKEITQLLTLENFRENEQLSKYGDTKSARAIMLVELKKLIEANPLFRDKLQFPNLRNSRLRTLINQRSNPDVKTLFVDHSCGQPNGARAPSPANNPLLGALPKAGGFPPLGAHGPFQPPQAQAPVPAPLAGWMSSSSTVAHPAASGGGPIGLGGPSMPAALKHPRTPPSNPALDYPSGDSDHSYLLIIVDIQQVNLPVNVMPISFQSHGHGHGPTFNAPDDLPKTAARTLNQGISRASNTLETGSQIHEFTVFLRFRRNGRQHTSTDSSLAVICRLIAYTFFPLQRTSNGAVTVISFLLLPDVTLECDPQEAVLHFASEVRCWDAEFEEEERRAATAVVLETEADSAFSVIEEGSGDGGGGARVVNGGRLEAATRNQFNLLRSGLAEHVYGCPVHLEALHSKLPTTNKSKFVSSLIVSPHNKWPLRNSNPW
ncbi:hypothetical protein ACFE04_017293 [Oxalis oulophora]